MNKDLLGNLQNISMETTEEESYYYKVIGDIMKEIHANIPLEEFDTAQVPVPTNIREENFQGVNYQRAVMYLLSNGCEWALKNANGCTMCGHLARQTRRTESIREEDLIHQFKKEFARIDFSKYPILNLYNNGSFLNDQEISSHARREILKTINGNSQIKMLVVETRPEFVSEEKIREIKVLMPDKHVEVAMGLELKDDLYRTICINKGFSLQQYEKAAKIITKYVNLRTYILLKPPFLTEREAIEEACKTVEYAFSLGSRIVSLEGCTIQDYTLVKCLADGGMYTTPWLWSIIEVVKRTRAKGNLIVGMFQFFPSPDTVPHNCPKCSEGIMEKIRKYNQTLDRKIFDSLTCSCKAKWEALLKENSRPFNERIKLFAKHMQNIS